MSHYRVSITEAHGTLTVARLTPDQVGQLLTALSDQVVREAAQGQPTTLHCVIEPDAAAGGVAHGESSAA